MKLLQNLTMSLIEQTYKLVVEMAAAAKTKNSEANGLLLWQIICDHLERAESDGAITVVEGIKWREVKRSMFDSIMNKYESEEKLEDGQLNQERIYCHFVCQLPRTFARKDVCLKRLLQAALNYGQLQPYLDKLHEEDVELVHEKMKDIGHFMLEKDYHRFTVTQQQFDGLEKALEEFVESC